MIKFHFILLSFAALLCLGCGESQSEEKQAAVPIVWSAPIVIQAGGIYSGNWRSLDPDVPAIKIETNEPVILENCLIESMDDGIYAQDTNADITIRNCQGTGLNPNVVNSRKGSFINVGNFVKLIVENNNIISFANGVRVLNYGEAANQYSGQIVHVRKNVFKNIDGRLSDGAGGYLNSNGTGGNAIGLNTLGKADVEISWNQVINQPFQSSVEDLISTYKSSGTTSKYILIHDNYLQGGYAPDPTSNHEYTGTMINISDSTGDVGFTKIYNNQVVSFENTGIMLSGGSNNEVFNNGVISAQKLTDGSILGGAWRQPFTIWDYYNGGSEYWKNNKFYDNLANVVTKDGEQARSYTPSLVGTTTHTGTVDPLGRLAVPSDEANELALWNHKRMNIAIGCQSTACQ